MAESTVDPAWVEKAREVVALADENAAKAMQHGVDYATEFRAELRQGIAQALADTDAAARGEERAECRRIVANIDTEDFGEGDATLIVREQVLALIDARTATTGAGPQWGT